MLPNIAVFGLAVYAAEVAIEISLPCAAEPGRCALGALKGLNPYGLGSTLPR